MPQEKNTPEKSDLWAPHWYSYLHIFTVSNLTSWLLETPDFRWFYSGADVDLCFFSSRSDAYATNRLDQVFNV